LDLDRIDDREVSDTEEAEHGKRENSNRNIGLTAISQSDTVRQFVQPRGVPTPEGVAPAAQNLLAEGRLHTLNRFSFALLLQAQSGSASEGSGKFLLGLIARSVVAQVVVFALLLFSILSWGIILYKVWVFYRANRHTAQFLDVFRRSANFSEVQAICRSVGDSPLVGMFQAGYAELTAQLRQSSPAVAGPSNPQPPANRPTLKSLSAVDRALMRASVVEMNKLEHGIPFLATTASVSPFIGLFGKVWGVMAAVQGLAATRSPKLWAGAPGP